MKKWSLTKNDTRNQSVIVIKLNKKLFSTRTFTFNTTLLHRTFPVHILHVETIPLKGIEEERKKSQTNKQFAKKAPQTRQFQFKNSNRLKPTPWQTTVNGFRKREQMNATQKKKRLWQVKSMRTCEEKEALKTNQFSCRFHRLSKKKGCTKQASTTKRIFRKTTSVEETKHANSNKFHLKF